MKRIFSYLVIIFVIAFSCNASAKETTKDINGWGKAKWGMTMGEVLKAYKGQAKPVYHSSDDNSETDVEIKELTIEYIKFHVGFVFNDPGKKLTKVYVRAIDKPDKSDFLTMERALTEKYGKPSSSSENYSPENTTRVELIRVWSFKSTKIELTFRIMTVESTWTNLLIEYTKNTKKTMDNI